MIMDREKLSKALARRGFKPYFFDNAAQAAEFVLKLIPDGASVGSGGSVSVAQTGLLPELAKTRAVYAHSVVPEEKRGAVYQAAAQAEWYVTSANAVTEDGELVNIDGAANRVGALCFGVPNIVYIVGVNKLTPDLTAAIERARNVAAPLNAKRLNKKTPCAVTGKCAYCNSPDCICNVTTIMHHPTKYQKAVYVLVVEQNLGY